MNLRRSGIVAFVLLAGCGGTARIDTKPLAVTPGPHQWTAVAHERGTDPTQAECAYPDSFPLSANVAYGGSPVDVAYLDMRVTVTGGSTAVFWYDANHVLVSHTVDLAGNNPSLEIAHLGRCFVLYDITD